MNNLHDHLPKTYTLKLWHFFGLLLIIVVSGGYHLGSGGSMPAMFVVYVGFVAMITMPIYTLLQFKSGMRIATQSYQEFLQQHETGELKHFYRQDECTPQSKVLIRNELDRRKKG